MKKLFAAAACLSLALSAAAWTGSDWMSELPDDAYVAQVSIPGTHDSATGHGMTVAGLNLLAQTQEKTLDEQLAMGIRAFDFRPKVKDNGLNAHHGIVNTKVTFDDIMKITLASFLDNHKDEFIIIHLLYASNYDKDKDKYYPLLKSLLESTELSGRIANFRRDLQVKDLRGKILIISRDEYASEPFGGFAYEWSEEFETIARRSRIKGPGNDEMAESKLFVQDIANTYNKGTMKDEHLTNLLNFTSTHSIGSDPRNLVWALNFGSSYHRWSTKESYKENATKYNSLIRDYVNSHIGPTGIVLMDFAGIAEANGIESVNAIISNNFRYHNTPVTPASGVAPQFQASLDFINPSNVYTEQNDNRFLPLVADFNGDGLMDVYFGGEAYKPSWNWGDGSYVALNEGFGKINGFTAWDNSGQNGNATVDNSKGEENLPILYGAHVRAFLDLDQDGAVDFVVWDDDAHGNGRTKYTGWGDINNRVVRNLGNGTSFATIEGAPNNIANNIHGSWGERVIGKNHRLSVGDVNNDGYPDLLITFVNGCCQQENGGWGWYDHGNRADLFINNGDGTFSRDENLHLPNIGGNLATALFGDFNCDGYPDILLNGHHNDFDGTGEADELLIYTNDRKGGFSLSYRSKVYTNGQDNTELCIHVLDYNQDGKQDILLIGSLSGKEFNNNRYGNNKVALVLCNTSKDDEVRFTEMEADFCPSSDASWRTSVLADFNGDGFLDYLGSGWGPDANWASGCFLSYSQNEFNRNYGMFNNLLQDQTYNGVTVANQDHLITYGDIDGDGMLDLISTNGNNRCPSVYLNKTLGHTTTTPQVADAPSEFKFEYNKETRELIVTWNAMRTPSGCKAIYNTFIEPLDDGLSRSASFNENKTYMRVPANKETGKLKAYVNWSEFVPGERCVFANVDPGMYRIGVQSVSYSYNASPFHTEVFTVDNSGKPTGVDETEISSEATSPVNVFSTMGVLLRRNVDAATATDGLPSGIYIVGNRKVVKQ